jgi:hypothetical protein
MIKLFRNIRKNLLNEGKTSKFFKYAIGEILLVVIGILIALSINTWNEERKEKAIVVNVLKNIRYDLISDTLRFSSILESIPKNLEKSKSLLKNTGLDTLSANELYSRMPTYGYLGTFKNQSYKKIINAGITEFFEFNQLFDDINTYYTTSLNFHDILTNWDYTAGLDEVKIWETMGFETDLSVLFDNENEDTFAQLETTRKEVFLNQLSTPTIRNTIKSNMHRKKMLHNFIIRINQEAKDIIQKIDKQLIE